MIVIMNKNEVLNKLNELKLNKDDYIIISGTSLVLHDVIDETKDIDISVSKKIYDSIDWEETKGYLNIIKTKDVFEIGTSYYNEKNIDIINGYKTMNLEECLKLKKLLNRSKDKKLIRQLDLLLAKDDNYRYEKELISNGIDLIAGVDEVGRGPLVGPVVASCVILPKNYHLNGLTDSKKLSEKKRNEFYDIIKRDAISIGIGIVDAKTIDEINIYEASKLAMKKAIKNLQIVPKCVLIDAMELDLDIPSISIVHGDFISQSIAAASVIAKVTRDNMMYELDKKYPEYEFAKHKGYPTKRHLEIIKKYGVLENYRFTYAPVRDLIYREKEVEKDEITN